MCCFHYLKNQEEEREWGWWRWGMVREASSLAQPCHMEEVGAELYFYWAAVSELDIVTFFISIRLGFQHLWNLLQGWKPHDQEIRKTYNRCILHWSPSILWNWSDFHNPQKWYNMPLKPSWESLAKLSTNYFKVIFFHHVYGHFSLAFWAW